MVATIRESIHSYLSDEKGKNKMFKYINGGEVVISIMMFIIISIVFVLYYGKSITDKKPLKYGWVFIVLFGYIFLSPIHSSWYTHKLISSNIKEFNANATLECAAGLQSYLVSKEKHWSVVNAESFLKDDLIIRADRCNLTRETDKKRRQ